MNRSVMLSGLDGGNPLAFLAALGSFRVLESNWLDSNLRMRWEVAGGAWRPVLSASLPAFSDDLIIDTLSEALAEPPQFELLDAIGNDLTISGRRLHFLAGEAVEKCHASPAHAINVQRTACDFVSAFGCDALTADGDPDSNIKDTALRTMSGAGHQHFIQFMRDLVAATDAGHLRSSLFEYWTYSDSGRGLNLRWDPADDRRYALRWKNPSDEPNMTMRGANRLALEALPLFVTAPDGDRLQTTGFTQHRAKGVRWTWPIWSGPLSFDVCRSVLQLRSLQLAPDNSESREFAVWRTSLAQLGIAEVFQSQRITIGKFRNFTPATSL